MANSEPGKSVIATYAPGGGDTRFLGQIGHVSGLTHSFNMPGGANQLTANLNVEPLYRSSALNPGRTVKEFRGGSCIWQGQLLEPVPSPAGIALTANGAGNLGSNFVAKYTTWTNQNDAINQAIARGLPWSNPGVPSGVWLGQQVDSGAQTITDLLNLFCTKGGYTWSVDQNNVLSVFLWSQSPPDRILTCTAPVPRTLGGDINSLFLRYQATGDSSANATFGLANATTPSSISAHGTLEDYDDISSAGTMTNSAAVALGQNTLSKYQRASFSGPFVVRYGEVLTIGGQPVDLGCERAGHIYRLIMTDYGYGGEVVPDPVTFVGGSVTYDDEAQTASIVPFQSIDLSLSSLLGNIGLKHGTAAYERRWPKSAL